MDKRTESANLRAYLAADTSEEMLALQHEIWMRSSEEERLQKTFNFIEDCRRLNLEGISNAHPEWTEAEVKREYFKTIYSPLFSEDVLKELLAFLVK